MSKTTNRYGKPTLTGHIGIDANPKPLPDPTVDYGIYRGRKYETICPVCSAPMVSSEGQWTCPLNGQMTQYEEDKTAHRVTGATDKRLGVVA